MTDETHRETDTPADAAPPSPELAAAIDLLSSGDTWCEGAKKLVELGERDGLIPLMRAYESRSEEDKVCLLRAIEALGAAEVSLEMIASPDPERRRLAAHMMELVDVPGHLEPLERASVDPDPRVRKFALRALSTQKQTPEWEATMIRLLSSPQREARAEAIESLSRRRTDTAREALRKRAATETDEALRKRLKRIVGD